MMVRWCVDPAQVISEACRLALRVRKWPRSGGGARGGGAGGEGQVGRGFCEGRNTGRTPGAGPLFICERCHRSVALECCMRLPLAYGRGAAARARMYALVGTGRGERPGRGWAERQAGRWSGMYVIHRLCLRLPCVRQRYHTQRMYFTRPATCATATTQPRVATRRDTRSCGKKQAAVKVSAHWLLCMLVGAGIGRSTPPRHRTQDARLDLGLEAGLDAGPASEPPILVHLGSTGSRKDCPPNPPPKKQSTGWLATMGDSDFFADAPLFRPDMSEEEADEQLAALEEHEGGLDGLRTAPIAISDSPPPASASASAPAPKRSHAAAFPPTAPPVHREHRHSVVHLEDGSDDADEPPAASSARTAREEQHLAPPWTRLYLGNVMVQAWSTTSGRGWLSNGDHVDLISETQQPSGSSSGTKKRKTAKQTTLSFGRPASDAGSGRSATTSRSRSSLAQLKKRDQNVLVYFTNPQGFEIGRILSQHSTWLSKLMRNRLVDLRGRVIDCPAKLDLGTDVLLSIDVFLHRSVFLDAGAYTLTSNHDDYSLSNAPFHPDDVAETEREYQLAQRKAMFLSLFDQLNLRPRLQSHIEGERWLPIGQGVGPAPETRSGSHTAPAQNQNQGQHPSQEEKDQENEAPPPDGTELGTKLIEQLYSKAGSELLPDASQRFAQGDMLPALPEKDPPPTFSLTLRPYQKQALWWMDAMESVTQHVPKASAGPSQHEQEHLHPLWKEYGLPSPPEGTASTDASEGPRQLYFK